MKLPDLPSEAVETEAAYYAFSACDKPLLRTSCLVRDRPMSVDGLVPSLDTCVRNFLFPLASCAYVIGDRMVLFLMGYDIDRSRSIREF